MKKRGIYKIKPEILQFMRQSAGMTDESVAGKPDLTKVEYLNIEKGKTPISKKDLVHLADMPKSPLIAFYSIIVCHAIGHHTSLNLLNESFT